MKKIYLLLISSFVFTYVANGQLSLTKASHEPVINDVEGSVEYDSTTAIPKSTGANQTWNFTSLVQTTAAASSMTFVAVSAPSASMFPGATIASTDGGFSDGYYKASASKFEMLGIYSPFFTMSYTTDPRTYAVWPVSYGNTFTDTYAGKIESIFGDGPFKGSATVTASGHGNLTLPGGVNFSTVLQVKTVAVESSTLVVGSTTLSGTETSVTYDYWTGGKKSPVVTVEYTFSDDTTVSINVNKDVIVGINDYNFDASFVIHPNPAKDQFKVKLDNAGNEKCLVTILSASGQVVKKVDLGDAIEINECVQIADLPSGIYFVKTNLGGKTSIRKLIVE